ncbi:MAG: acyltransferase [Arenimonas sp.]|jgi:peptidoglycan/LPS O-acetylase OafA/YrhL
MNKKRRHRQGPLAAQLKPSASGDAGPGAPSPERWPALTGLRGIAALAVLLFHAFILAGKPPTVAAPLAWLFSAGWSGVDIFFTLSAFLLTIPFVRTESTRGVEPSLRVYGQRRLLRILPAYYVQAAILIALGLLGLGVTGGWSEPTLPAIFANLFFLYGALPDFGSMVPPWWTLPVELGFYLVLPLFAKCLRPRRWGWLLLGIALSLAYRFWLMNAGLTRAEEIAWVEHLPGRLHQFLVGMLAAYAFVRLQARAALPGARAADLLAASAAIVFVLLPALGLLVSEHAFDGVPVRDPLLLCWHLLASVVVAVLLIALAAGAPRVGRLFSSAPARALGLVSYSLYLWHFPVMLALRESLGYASARENFWAFVFYSLLFSLLVAGASWWLVERPAQQWRRQAKLGA